MSKPTNFVLAYLFYLVVITIIAVVALRLNGDTLFVWEDSSPKAAPCNCDCPIKPRETNDRITT